MGVSPWTWSARRSNGGGGASSKAKPSASFHIAAVLDLPGMVEDVPGDPAGRVPLRPAPLYGWTAVRCGSQGVGDLTAKGCDRGAVPAIRSGQTQSKLSNVGRFSVEHVIGDLVTVTPSTAGTLAERCGGAAKHLVENRPGRADQRCQPLRFWSRHRLRIPFGDFLGRAKISGRPSPKMLPNAKDFPADFERNPRRPGYGRVARRIGRQGGQRRGLVLSRPAPPRPVKGADKDPLAAGLDVDVGHRALGLAETLDDHRHSLAAPHAHRLQPNRLVLSGEAVQERAEDAGTGHAERMAERDGAAVRIEFVAERIDAQLAGGGDHLGGKGFVDFDDVDIVDRHLRPLESLTGGLDRAE